MGVEYHQCEACQESFYEECVTICEGCGEPICVSCVINLPERIRLGRGSIFDKTTDILSGEDGLLEEHCPFCSGDAVSADQIMNWLLRRVNMTEDEVAKQIREVTKQIREGKKQIREGKKRLTKEIAEVFLVRKDDFVDIAQFTELDDDAAESLSRYRSPLSLKGLTSLSDAAAESLSKHEGRLHLNGLTMLSDAAAESLSKHKGTLSLDGLTGLSDAAAESLSKHEGSLSLDLNELPESAAEILRQHPSFQEDDDDDEDWDEDDE